MNDLRQRLHETLDSQHTDLLQLAALARLQGRHLRRRRRLAVTSASLATVAVLAVGVASATQLLPGPEDVRPAGGFASQDDATVPASGRSVAAAAIAAVDEVADGTVGRIRGGVMSPITDDNPDNKGEVLAEHVAASFAFTPAGASSPGEVMVDVTHMLEAGKSFDMLDTDPCPATAVECETSTLPDGSQAFTFRFHDDETTNGDPAGGDAVYAVREIGDVRVTVWAANGLDSPMLKGTRLPNQPQAVLSTEQVKAIVSQPWWGLELPAEFSGDDLPSFELLPGGAGSL